MIVSDNNIEITCAELLEMYQKYPGAYICYMLVKHLTAHGFCPDEKYYIRVDSKVTIEEFKKAQPNRFLQSYITHSSIDYALLQRFRARTNFDELDAGGQRKTRVNLMRSIDPQHVFKFEFEYVDKNQRTF